MTIYILIYIVLFVFSLMDIPLSSKEKLVRKTIMVLIGCVVIVIAGIRWETGTDWNNYLRYFNTISALPIGQTTMETGYEFLVRRFNNLSGGNYSVFLFFCSFFIVSLSYYSIYKLSPKPLLTLCILWAYSLVASGFGVRQDMAIAITLLSTLFIVKRRLIPFSILIFVAFLIHRSSLIFFPAYFIYSIQWTKLKVTSLLITVLIFALLAKGVMSHLFPIVATYKADLYLEGVISGQLSGVPLMIELSKSLVIKLMFLSIILSQYWGRELSKEGDSIYKGLTNIYIMGMVLYICFVPIHSYFDRIARPYDIFHVILLAMAIHRARLQWKIALFVIIFSISSLKLYNTLSAPKQYVPYKTILSKL